MKERMEKSGLILRRQDAADKRKTLLFLTDKAKDLEKDYIAEKHPDLVPLYDEIYNRKNRSYFEALVNTPSVEGMGMKQHRTMTAKATSHRTRPGIPLCQWIPYLKPSIMSDKRMVSKA